jgi:outer membrane autotransporter protein
MYAGQQGDATLWGQEFTQNLNVGSKTTAGGYDNTGFGFVLGADTGNPRNGRYGAAFQFYSGDTNEKGPRTDKTNSEWLMLTGYTDWRGRGFFFDSQASMGYAQLRGQRFINVGSASDLVSRDARGDRSGEFLSGGATAGVILSAGGTVFTPQLSLDGLTMREEGYTETSSTATDVISRAEDGYDLTVKPNYMDSLRLFAGADVRQDLNFGGFYLQPDLRAGYRYDFIDGQAKVKAAFVSQAADPANYFTITGPDPARGNLVLGGGLATTTGAWSVGVSYDYVKGIGGTNTLNQIGTFTIVGRM